MGSIFTMKSHQKLHIIPQINVSPIASHSDGIFQACHEVKISFIKNQFR